MAQRGPSSLIQGKVQKLPHAGEIMKFLLWFSGLEQFNLQSPFGVCSGVQGIFRF